MRVSRNRGSISCFGGVLLLVSLMPSPIGRQDLASLFARQSGVPERWRAHLIASPFGTIHAATLSFARPVGTAMPEPLGIRLASLDPDAANVTGLIASRFFDAQDDPLLMVNRARKGDRLIPRAQQPNVAQGLEPASTNSSIARAKDEDRMTPETAEPAVAGQGQPAKLMLASVNPSATDIPAVSPQQPISIGPGAAPAERRVVDQAAADADAADADTDTPEFDGEDLSPAVRTARIYFSTEPMGSGASAKLEPWAAGEIPVFETPSGPTLAMLSPPDAMPDDYVESSAKGGETVAGKGEVTGKGRRPMSPAERLGLSGAARSKQEKCLADAIYFEARGESVRGQMAVAQVVMNRVFSGFYPDNVCGVVYQNAHRHLACQFTFACDGIRDRVTEPDAWERAQRIAHDTLDGKYWLTDVGKATHYHAYWVHPWWVRTMRKLDRIGVHTFYRPKRWGDGADSPVWGDAQATKEAQKNL